MYVFSHSALQHHFSDAEQLLYQFVSDIPNVYGDSMLVSNTHALLHLPLFVSLYGEAYAFSAYPFENFLQSVKRYAKKLQHMYTRQIVNRCTEGVLGGRKRDYRRNISSLAFYYSPSDKSYYMRYLNNDCVKLVIVSPFFAKFRSLPVWTTSIPVHICKVSQEPYNGESGIPCFPLYFDSGFVLYPMYHS